MSTTLQALQAAIKGSIRCHPYSRYLHHGTKITRIKDILDDVCEDVMHFERFPTTRVQLLSTFYQLLDDGEIPMMEGYRRRRRARLESRRRKRYMRSRGRAAASRTTTTTTTTTTTIPVGPHPPVVPPPPSRPRSSTGSSASHAESTIPLPEQRSLLSDAHRACLYACFNFCKQTLRADIARGIDDPVASQLSLSVLIEAIISAYNSGRLAPELIDEEAGFGPGNAFERAACVVDAVVWKGSMGDRRLLSVLQAAEEIVGALRDGERGERIDVLYKRAERMIREGGEAPAAEAGERVEETTDDEDRALDLPES